MPGDLRAITLRAMAKQPEERFQNADAFSRALADVAARHPLEVEDFERAMDLPEMPTQRIAITRPGSTQGRLDRQFRMTATPVPDSLPAAAPDSAVAPVPAPTAAPPVRSPLAEAVEGISRLVGEGKLDLAAQRLEAAQARYGEERELVRMRGEVGAALAAQREARVLALTGEARELSSGGRHSEAVRRLEQARAISPGNPTVDSLLAEATALLQATQGPAAPPPPPPVEPPPHGAEREGAPKSTRPPRRGLAVIGVAGAAVVVAGLAIVIIGREDGRTSSVPTPVSQVPTSVVAPTPSGPTPSEMLAAAEAALARGDMAAVEAELERIEGLEDASLGGDEEGRLGAVRDALAGQRGKSLARDLERALGSGNLERLSLLL
ncbi:MAG: hypothetical protein ACOY3Y_19035, partial [Acidobacteriota bacterium]